MAVVKDVICTTLFLCMFFVLLLVMQLHEQMRVSVNCNDVVVASQASVIQNNIKIVHEKEQQVNNLKIEILDLRELVSVLQDKIDTFQEQKLEILELFETIKEKREKDE